MAFGRSIKERIESLLGKPSKTLSERCPRGFTTWPETGCTKNKCVWWIRSTLYKNCSFLAAEICDHTLAEIGDMMGISRERVRQIEGIAIRKLRYSFRVKESKSVLHKQSLAKRCGQNSSKN